VIDAERLINLLPQLANYIIDNYKSCVVVINKWDTAFNRTETGQKEYEDHIRQVLKFHYFVPVLFSSAKTGYNVNAVVDAAIKVAEERKVKISTNRLFQILEQCVVSS
jgi:GTP-binding protein